MSGWRDLARRLKEQEGARDDRDELAPVTPAAPVAPAAPIVPIVPIVPRAVSQFVPRADPAAWLAALVALDTSRPPAGIMPDLWPVVLADALWIARAHGDNAAALGWSASDLFGLSAYPGEGGLADRLEGARRLAFTSGVAHWRGDESEGWLWRRTLTAKPPIWEV